MTFKCLKGAKDLNNYNCLRILGCIPFFRLTISFLKCSVVWQRTPMFSWLYDPILRKLGCMLLYMQHEAATFLESFMHRQKFPKDTFTVIT